MKKIIIPIILCVVAILILLLVFNNKKQILRIVQDESFFSDFKVENGKVYINCELKIQNLSSEDKVFSINAIMKEDVVLGLLVNENLQGYNLDLNENTFKVDKKSDLRTNVVFVGEFAGTNKKTDRRLPQINITEVDY